MPRTLLGLVVASALYVGGCDDSTETQSDPTPENQYGVHSKEFERDDIERAEDASDEVKEYCSDAVSEAQRIGCESHVDESDIP
jgi:hypothetical protein